MLALEISKISKSYKNKLVLDAVDLKIKHNNIFGFIGLNGAGKTTLIKIILDLISRDDGNVKIFGVENSIPSSRKKLCYLPEKFSPSQNSTGIEFIKFSLGFYNKKYQADLLYEKCNSLDLNFDILKNKIGSYSKGMTQKLGLISTFLTDADLIILDEHMSGLDVVARTNLKKELLNYKSIGKTIFFSSHILTGMEEICDEIAVLHNRKILYNGDPKEFMRQQNSSSLDDAFLGSVNLSSYFSS